MKTLNLRQSRDFGAIITDTFIYLRIHFKSLGKGLLFFSLPLIVISGILVGSGMGTLFSSGFEDPEVLNNLPGFGIKFFSGLLLLMLTFLFIIIIVFKHIQLIDEGVEDFEVGMLLEDFGRNFFGLVGILFVISVASMLGMIFFILPGIYLSVKLSLAPAIYVIEGEDFGEAISKSWRLTGDHWWFTFGVSFVISIIMNMISNAVILPLYFIMMIGVFATGEPNPETLGTFFSLFYGFTMIAVGLGYCFPIISQALVYFHLEEKKSGRSLFDKIDAIKED